MCKNKILQIVIYLNRTTEANIEVEDSHRTDKGLLNKPITPNQRKQSKSVCEVHLVHLASSQKSPQTRDHSDSGTDVRV